VITEPVVVVVVDSRPLFGVATAAALSEEAGLDARTLDPSDALAPAAILRSKPDVVILDARLPGDCLDLCCAIKVAEPLIRVLISSEYDDQELLLAALESGADGFVSRAASPEELARSVARVNSGEACIPSEMLGFLLRRLIQRRRVDDAVLDRFSRLSRREKEVFALVVEGRDHRAIAEMLVLSPHTARTHIQNVLEKLEVHSRMEAATLAIEHQLIERFAGKGA
jgi:DNA-binding NarL/FixJ family response regulator